MLISIALHATAFTYPVVFLRSQGAELVTVVVLSAGDETEEGVKSDRPAEGKKGKPVGPRYLAPARQTERSASEEKNETPVPKYPISISLSPADGSLRIALASAVAAPKQIVGSLSMAPGNGDVGEGGSGSKGIAGFGTGAGVGHKEGRGGAKFVQVTYTYSPKPEYPDKARREGTEGRVLLRVFVDEQGRSKSVEVNQSSGSEVLDKAAAQAIKHWRFSPAHYGDKPVESWVRIPVDFRLTDLKD